MILEAKALLFALENLHGRAGFSSTGAAPFFLPELTVDGVGDIAFPLSAQQARALVEVAEVAPYGKGTKTKRDENVRKCWQLDAEQFSFRAKAWDKYLKATLAKISTDLGINGKIAAVPYKLLLYGPGGHFKAHRDTEKLNSMFGTLIVALPSRHEGGQLHIRHGGEQVSVDFSAEAHRHDFQHAAFFADCEHEVVPVQSGYRFCVVFNLVLKEGDPAPLNLTAEDHAGPLGTLLTRVVKEQGVASPVVILLQHQYTEANFSLRKLKGNDRQRAAALFAAAGKARLTARLALATFYQMGELEDGYAYGYDKWGRAKWDDDPDKGKMGEVYDESFELDHWRDADDRKLKIEAFPIDLEDVITAEDFSTVDPDEKSGEGYTGNAGCSMEYWYRRAAVVLWPEGSDEEIRCVRNIRDACESLLGMSTGKKTGEGSLFDKLARAAIRVMAASENCDDSVFRSLDVDSRLPITRLALALVQAKRADLVEKLAREMDSRRFVVIPQAVWRGMFSLIEPDLFADVFRDWVQHPEEKRKSLFALLGGLCDKRSRDPWVVRIASVLARLKPVEISRWEDEKSRDPIPPGDCEESGILLSASRRLTQKADVDAAIGFLKSDGSLFAVRCLIGPLFSGAVNERSIRESEVAKALLLFCKDTLEREIARPILPYPDWKRPCPPLDKQKVSGRYGRRDESLAVLEELAAFMADPAVKESGIRRREDLRSVAEEFIRTHHLDVDCKTLRQGTPHTLVCTKNDQSYRHQQEWRKKDEIMLKKLERLEREA